jgi:hypothetical protein
MKNKYQFLLKLVKCTLLCIYTISAIQPLSFFAVSTNEQANPWTREKAEHLARRALIGPTETILDTLANA